MGARDSAIGDSIYPGVAGAVLKPDTFSDDIEVHEWSVARADYEITQSSSSGDCPVSHPEFKSIGVVLRREVHL